MTELENLEKILGDKGLLINTNKVEEDSIIPISNFEMEMFGSYKRGILYKDIKPYNESFKRYNKKIKRKIKFELLRHQPIGKLFTLGVDYAKDKAGIQTTDAEILINEHLSKIKELNDGLGITIENYQGSIERTTGYSDEIGRNLLYITENSSRQEQEIRELKALIPELQTKAKNGNEQEKVIYTFALRRINQKLLKEQLMKNRDLEQLEFNKKESPFVNDLLDTAIYTVNSLKSVHQQTTNYHNHVGQTLDLYLRTIYAGELYKELELRVGEMSKFTTTIDRLFVEGVQRISRAANTKFLSA